MNDALSWYLIEKGWRVVSVDGRDVGRVSEVIGDRSQDIFDGLGVRPRSRLQPHYVPADQVASITQGAVALRPGIADVERLDEGRHVFLRTMSVSQRVQRWLRAQRL
jgi:hypothetical protein